MADGNGKPSGKSGGGGSEEWLQALRELEEFDLKREERTRHSAQKEETPKPRESAPRDTPAPEWTPVPLPRPKQNDTPRPNIVARRPDDEDAPTAAYEMSLDDSGSMRVEAATPIPIARDVSEQEGAARAPRSTGADTPTPRPTDTPRPSREAMKRYDEMRKRKSVTVRGEDIKVMEEMSEVICTVNTATSLLEEFRKKYGEAITEQKYNGWRNTLRDTSMIMLKEFHALRNGRQAKTYDKRNICSVCHTVFMEPLPADRICDECRSRTAPRGPVGE